MALVCLSSKPPGWEVGLSLWCRLLQMYKQRQSFRTGHNECELECSKLIWKLWFEKLCWLFIKTASMIRPSQFAGLTDGSLLKIFIPICLESSFAINCEVWLVSQAPVEWMSHTLKVSALHLRPNICHFMFWFRDFFRRKLFPSFNNIPCFLSFILTRIDILILYILSVKVRKMIIIIISYMY